MPFAIVRGGQNALKLNTGLHKKMLLNLIRQPSHRRRGDNKKIHSLGGCELDSCGLG